MFWGFPLTLSQFVLWMTFIFLHVEEFGSYQILAILEKNRCCRATNTDVAVLLNCISWFWNADRLWVFLYPAEWVLLGSTRSLITFCLFVLIIQLHKTKKEWSKRRKKKESTSVFWGSSPTLFPVNVLVIQRVYIGTALEEELGATKILYAKNLTRDYLKIILWIPCSKYGVYFPFLWMGVGRIWGHN